MEAYLVDVLSVVVRWLHLITGIAWIGASFHFVWLDN
ncbi:MAG: putative membrane protein, partial [Urechidicola sp.]